ncbi:YdaS family helix-turn-helix protein [Sinorhizobium sp. RAC02]|uniref:transcriptional regulator n=1 Tax=Sinorhizobium sp. RAC02 TaxID=1842534 RepID=UPI00085550AF|nr:YdaS family helix-turn-helix protein [Sinorhizobium sp. RAC02]AOF88532.1 antirepressor Cro domain protein [Sinorhizobium sp. RAC02]
MKRKTNSHQITRLLEAAITIAGSEAKLGALAGYSQNAIWYAKRNGRVSAELASAIDRATNGAISKSQLRPDMFPPVHAPPVSA